MQRWICLMLALSVSIDVRSQDAASSRSIRLSIHDQGYADVSEDRVASIPGPAEPLVLRTLPARLDPSSLILSWTGRSNGLSADAYTFDIVSGDGRLTARLDPPPPTASLQLRYMVNGLNWWAYHALRIRPDQRRARLDTRIRIRNDTGGSFPDAQVRLISTQRGQAELNGADQTRQYRYGDPSVRSGTSAAGVAPHASYVLKAPVRIEPGADLYLPYAATDDVEVKLVHVYDGVQFDRFPRNPQTDWSYGTAHRDVVDTYVQFRIPNALPAGRVRVMEERADGLEDFLGETVLLPGGSSTGTLHLGTARSLSGARERISYTEIKPLHEYEETFEIRLANEATESIDVRVVEHLYRGTDFEIVKSDAEYVESGPQQVEFNAALKPGGKAIIRYTVRYRW